MVLELKLRKIGNSVGIFLPRKALTHLKADAGDTISLIKAPDGSLHLSSAKGKITRQMDVMRDVTKRYRNTLRKLGKQ